MIKFTCLISRTANVRITGEILDECFVLRVKAETTVKARIAARIAACTALKKQYPEVIFDDLFIVDTFRGWPQFTRVET